MGAKEHYEKMLADKYLWAFGTHEENAAEFTELMKRMGLTAKEGSIAVDLGCGPGYQALAMADAGYGVIAVDSCAALLNELNQRINGKNIQAFEDDVLNFRAHCEGRNIELMICVGDVLAHLDSMEAVDRLLKMAREALASGGKLLVAFRDQTVELKDADRIIPFHSDDNRIMTTLLEFSEERVKVTDVIYEREGQSWRLEKSEYYKTRLRAESVREALVAAGFEIVKDEVYHGFTNILAKKP